MDQVRIMCVVDCSDSGEDALRYAIAKAKQQDAQLTVARLSDSAHHANDDEQRKPLTERLWWSPRDECDIETTIEELPWATDPAEQIVRLAERLAIDHIVMGTSGHEALHHREIGGTAQRVVSTASCAVTVVNNNDVPN